jgi:low temperature requirement protein LtrA
MEVTAAAALPNGPVRIFLGFYLVNRCTMLLLNLYYMFLFPRFQFNFAVNILGIMLPAVFWLSGFMFSSTSYGTAVGLCWTGLALDLLLPGVWVLLFRYWDVWSFGKLFGWKLPEHRTALNVEHTAERQGLFIILSLGEYAVAILYSNIGGDLDMYLFGKAILGLLIAMGLRWIYFEGLLKIQQHALRRHAVAGRLWTVVHRSKSLLNLPFFLGVIWGILHFPLSACIILNGSTSAALIAATDYGTSYNKY